ncbi:metal ABC transporter permease [Leucobacter sp. OH1287]|uniref:metal ABC transporter permease n=1 Tax=Leucobacter sp. OH1287 TaxID=2491049 RepID=UPI000F5F8D37|nr:metal ABC transporter permease [Leucobacter sp. OH1287]RRD60608.1 metal ABC transporter permease [Leucobacter sp. OH1287]
MDFTTGAFLITLVTALACAVPGIFIVLRQDSMLVDAIAHSVLPGIIIGYLFTADLQSPLLLIGAALAALLVVLATELLKKSGLLSTGTPIGLVFPALFSIGVMLLSTKFTNVHLDTHAVLVGDTNLAAFEQLEVFGLSLGPRYLYTVLSIFVLNLLFVWLLYPRLKVTTFDPAYAKSIGIKTGAVRWALMLSVAITVTGAFHSAGAILTPAMLIMPVAAGIMLVKKLTHMLLFTVGFAALGSVTGFWSAYYLDQPTSPAVALVFALLFTLSLIISKTGRRANNSQRAAVSAAAS